MRSALISILLFLATRVKDNGDTVSLAFRAILEQEVFSWNSGDAPAYAKHFTQSGTFTNIGGMFFCGQKQFLDRHRELFQGIFANTVLQQEVVSFRLLRPEVAIVETLAYISGLSKDRVPTGVHIDSHGRLYSRLLQVFEKERSDWKIVVYHNVDLKSDTLCQYER
ncbi:SgcJ/EcaC family oxidoreductase [Rhodocytophaga rosea]|uniref:SgcJ/EcaC family oxidoreductase n=1 Tax=Rhodocytophaga rosea TaxID=2704465 RepID=A0A6C0GRX3_9BACT|nr:SgcJ/EcaC family oxidoreductase [Rhodocytophaga rosea]QHT70841.1 SgcJ/EcaC family oxidoreductase [Rhodocytophaga rosea]